MKIVTIDPITRLEGHGKISIFLNDQGNVENAYLQIPELRGFERFAQGRRAEDMPQITSRICGVCPVAHHFASTKALDAAFNVDPPAAAKKLRELMYMGYYIYDHTLHFYYLGGPDFVVGPDAPPAKRNIIGVIEKAGVEIGKEVIKHRAYGQKITAILGGKATHPVCGLPGGISKGLNKDEVTDIKKMVDSCIEFAKFSLKLFDDIVLANKKYVDLILDSPTKIYCAGKLEQKDWEYIRGKNGIIVYTEKISGYDIGSIPFQLTFSNKTDKPILRLNITASFIAPEIKSYSLSFPL